MDLGVVGFLLPFLLFLGLFFGIHVYVYLRFREVYALGRNGLIVAFAFPMFFILSMVLSRVYSLFVFRWMYVISNLFVGVVFYLVLGLVLRDVVNLVFRGRFDLRNSLLVVIVFCLAVSLYGFYNATGVHVNEFEVPIVGLDHEMDVVHLSDVHIGAFRDAGFLSFVVDMVNDLDSDVVLITGDLFDGSWVVDEDHVADVLKRFNAPVYFTIGNHEIYEGVDGVSSILNDSDVIVLRDEIVVLDGVQIIGADFPLDRFNGDNEYIYEMEPDEGIPSILMYHPPTGYDVAASKGVDLQLSGHTHGGQLFPFNYVVGLLYPYVAGLYDVDGMKLFVSSGTGTWGPPMRVGTYNDIALIHLVPA